MMMDTTFLLKLVSILLIATWKETTYYMPMKIWISFIALPIAGMLGLSSTNNSKSNVFFIQLPKKDRAEKAFEMIRKKLKKSVNGIDD